MKCPCSLVRVHHMQTLQRSCALPRFWMPVQRPPGPRITALERPTAYRARRAARRPPTASQPFTTLYYVGFRTCAETVAGGVRDCYPNHGLAMAGRGTNKSQNNSGLSQGLHLRL
jgi:hypothetical protein